MSSIMLANDGNVRLLTSTEQENQKRRQQEDTENRKRRRKQRHLAKTHPCLGRDGRCTFRVPIERRESLCGHCKKRNRISAFIENGRHEEVPIDIWGTRVDAALPLQRTFRPHSTDHHPCVGECQPDTTRQWSCVVCFDSRGHFIELGCACKDRRIHYECMVKCAADECPTCRQVVERRHWRPARQDLIPAVELQGVLIGVCAFPRCRTSGGQIYDNNVAVLDCLGCEGFLHPRCLYEHIRSLGPGPHGHIPCVCDNTVPMRVSAMVHGQNQGCEHFKRKIADFMLNYTCNCTSCPCMCSPCCVTSFSILNA